MLAAVRHQAALALRSRVAGADPQGRARRIWGSPGERWFSPTDPVWRVHADASMFLSGVRALLLQACHPVAMAGVAQNSTYREDPWARLQQISGFISMTTFGAAADAEQLMKRIRLVHSRIGGVAPSGRVYRADDPDLLLWVHSAEIDSFLTGYQRFSPTPLSAAEADLYVEQTARIGAGIGVPDPPTTVAALERTLASYTDVLAGGPDALDVVRFLRQPSELDAAGRVGYTGLYWGAIATLPAYARDLLGIDWSATRLRMATGAGGLGVRAIAWMLSDPLVQDDRRTFEQLHLAT